MADTERRLVSFWAGGRVKKKATKGAEMPVEEQAEKRGGKVKVTIKKAKGGRVPKPTMTTPPLMLPPTNPMEGRMDTGIVGRKSPGRRALPTIGGALGPLR